MSLIGQAVSQKKMFENNGHVHVYSPGEVPDNPVGSKCFQKHKSSYYFWSFASNAYAKFQDHRISGSREEDFIRFIPYMGVAVILVM